MDLQTRINGHSWFHGINFGPAQSRGRATPENWSLHGVLAFMERLSFEGLRVLDVGTMDGLIAFIAEQEGAAEVVATDLYDRDSFRLSQDILESAVTYSPRTNIEDLLPRFGKGAFDVVVMSGLLYHLLSPLRAALIGRFLLKTGGILLLETVTINGAEPDLRFNPGAPVVDEYTTFFVPTVTAVDAILRFALFAVEGTSVVQHRRTGSYFRTSYAARAVSLREAAPSTDLMRKAQERAARSATDRLLDEFGLQQVLDFPLSGLRAEGLDQIPKTIDPHSFRCRFRLQPQG